MICTVIPALDSEKTLGLLLGELRVPASRIVVSRIVVSDGGSQDRTLEIAIRAGAAIAAGQTGRGGQLSLGAKWSGDCTWLLFLHSDSRLPDGWERRAARHIKQFPDAAGYFDLRFDSPKFSARILEALVRIRCKVFGLPYGDQGLLISKALYAEIGGYPDIPLFEDVALIRALGKRRIRRLGLPLTTSADKYERDGFFRRGWRNFRLLRRYLKGECPEELLKAYR